MPSARLSVTPFAPINGSTYNPGSFVLENISTDGAQLNTVTIDLSGSVFGGMIFDPAGGAGDNVAKAFTVDSQSGTFTLVSATPGNGSDALGYKTLTLQLQGFDPGESLQFSIDVDPASIKGTNSPGPGESGSVNGLELTGSQVSFGFTGGQGLSNEIFKQANAVGGGVVTVQAGLPVTPTLSVSGVSGSTATVASAQQTVNVSGPAGATVRVLVIEGGAFTQGAGAGSQQLGPFDSNTALGVTSYDVTLNNGGNGQVAATLAHSVAEGGHNIITAAVVGAGGVTGPATAPVILNFGTTATAGVTVTPSGGSTSVTEGGATDTLNVALNTQPTANVTVTVGGDADITPSPTTLTFTPQNWNAAQTVTVTAVNDTTVEATETHNLTFTTASSQAAYNGLSVAPQTVTVIDNDSTQPQPIAFTQTTLAGLPDANYTSLQFGPDGRLYLSQVDGTILAVQVQATSGGGYQVAPGGVETINATKQITNHNDDGALATGFQGTRQVTGLVVTGGGTAPVSVYVSSSDPRIGAGPSGGDSNLDTNSGVISKLTQQAGGGWSRVDLVRGLPRSEENHSVNGMQITPDGQTMYVSVGGNTNMGAPSNNFAYTPEYAYSAAILKVDLGAVEAMSNKTDPQGNVYKYNLPTLPAGSSDPFPTDPFGGRDGLSQARIVAGGPVQIYSPGYRNAYDLVLTQSGQLYTVDNGANAGWGGTPALNSSGQATNAPVNGGVDVQDALFRVTQGFYGGHPNPIRANPSGAGVYLDGSTTPSANPSGWPPVPTADSAESVFKAPSTNGALYSSFGASTNGLTEYTASTFNSAMKGDLVIVSWDDKLYRVDLSSNGLTANSVTALTGTSTVLGGGQPLDVTARGDGQSFAGTVWVANYGGPVTVFTPGSGPPPPPPGTGDADGDGLNDKTDRFAEDATNGKGTDLVAGQTLTWSFSQNIDPPGPNALFNMGFTGLMSNGVDAYTALYNAANIKPGGAAAGFQVEQVPAGDALAGNTQQNGFQFGVDVNAGVTRFVVETKIDNPFGGTPSTTPVNYKSQGFFIGTGDQDNYLKIVAAANNGAGGIEIAGENGGAFTSQMYGANITGANIQALDTITLRLNVNVASGQVTPTWTYTVNGQSFDGSGAAVQLSGATLQALQGSYTVAGTPSAMAVGIISTSYQSNQPFTAFWDSIKITASGTGPSSQLALTTPSVTLAEGNSGATAFNYTVARTGDSTGAASAGWAVTGSGANPANAADFQGGVLPSGTVSFAAGETSKVVIVNVVGDATAEQNEGFTLTLSGASGATLGTATASGTITNDDGVPPSQQLALTTPSVTLAEGNSGVTAFNYTVARTGGSTGTASANWSVAGSGANPANAADFQNGALPSGTVSFAAGETSKIITVNVVGDTTTESTETFTLTLSGASGASLGTATATGTITNDDGGTGGQVFTSTGPGSTFTGGAGNDTFNASQGNDSLTGGAGADVFRLPTEPWAPIHIMDFAVGTDRLDLSALFQASGYTGSNPIADGYIVLASDGAGGTIVRYDRDAAGPNPIWPNTIIDLHGVSPSGLTWAQLSGGGAPPPPPTTTVALSTPSVTLAEGNSGITAFSYAVIRNGDTTGVSSANWAVAGSGANPANAADFQNGVLPSGTVSFAAGETSKIITVNVVGDTATESNEGFTVTLSGATGATLGTATAAGTITNDDGAPPPPGGQVFNSPAPGSTLTGGAGNDTFNASQGNDVLTGGGGADVFNFPAEPWAPIRITDFTPGQDKLDLRALFDAAGYTGTNPIGAGYMFIESNGSGGSLLRFDHDAGGSSPVWPNTIINLNIEPAQVSVSDWIMQ